MKTKLSSKETGDNLHFDLQMETLQTDEKTKHLKKLQQKLNEIYDKSQHLPHYKLASMHLLADRWLRIIATQTSEGVSYADDSPTSCVSVENELANCIFGCLGDSHEQNGGIQDMLNHIQSYKVVRPLEGKNHSVSLTTVEVLLQDNYKDSLLHRLFELLLKDSDCQNRKTKAITF